MSTRSGPIATSSRAQAVGRRDRRLPESWPGSAPRVPRRTRWSRTGSARPATPPSAPTPRRPGARGRSGRRAPGPSSGVPYPPSPGHSTSVTRPPQMWPLRRDPVRPYGGSMRRWRWWRKPGPTVQPLRKLIGGSRLSPDCGMSDSGSAIWRSRCTICAALRRSVASAHSAGAPRWHWRTRAWDVETLPWRFTEKDKLPTPNAGRVPVIVDDPAADDFYRDRRLPRRTLRRPAVALWRRGRPRCCPLCAELDRDGIADRPHSAGIARHPPPPRTGGPGLFPHRPGKALQHDAPARSSGVSRSSG